MMKRLAKEFHFQPSEILKISLADAFFYLLD